MAPGIEPVVPVEAGGVAPEAVSEGPVQGREGLQRVAEADHQGLLVAGADDGKERHGPGPSVPFLPADMDEDEVDDLGAAAEGEHLRMQGPFPVQQETALHPSPHLMQERRIGVGKVQPALLLTVQQYTEREEPVPGRPCAELHPAGLPARGGVTEQGQCFLDGEGAPPERQHERGRHGEASGLGGRCACDGFGRVGKGLGDDIYDETVPRWRDK